MSQGISIRHSGDLGDIFFSLSLLAAIPGKHTMRLADRPGVTGLITPRAPLIKSLLESQPYIAKVECSEKPVDIDLVPFRRFHGATTTLVSAQCNEYNVQGNSRIAVDGSEPWLCAAQSTETKGRIVIARSPRYQNRYFPWQKIVGYYGQRLLFIGLPEEHRDFCMSYGWVQHRKVRNLLEIAELIAGADLFIGNQSSPHAIALGLGVRMISEVCIEQPDCIYHRDNVQYVADGTMELDDFMGHKEVVIGGIDPPMDFNRSICPPGMWQYPETPSSSHYGSLIGFVANMQQISKEEADKKIYIYNVNRCPEFFHNGSNDPLALFKQAMINAKLSFTNAPQPSITKT